MKKRILAVIMILVLNCNLLIPVLSAEKPANPRDKKITCTATLDDNFADDTVIVVVNSTNSLSGKKINLKSFGTDTFDGLEEFKIDTDKLDNYEYINSEEYRRIIYLKLKKPGKENVLSAIKKLEGLDFVESAEPSYISTIDNGISDPEEVNIPSEAYRTTAVNSNIPDDPSYSEQYSLSRIKAAKAWNYTTGSHDIKVAVIDTGIYPHTDLNVNLAEGWNFQDDNADTTDLNGHGTHVAGIIGAAGNNSLGITGVCWNITLVPLKISVGDTNTGYIEPMCKAIQYATDNNIPIINLSFSFEESNALAAIIKNYNGLLICSAGNDSRNIDAKVNSKYPASLPYDNILSVASLQSNNVKLSTFSNYGKKNVDIAAPGEDILSTYLNDTYCMLSGTSMAAPLVTGAAALIKSYCPELSVAEIKYILMTSGNSSGTLKGKLKSDTPILNAENALFAAEAIFVNPLMGDVNGDGKIDTQDVIVLMKYNAGWNIRIVEKLADVDGDASINTQDVILLMKYNAGWDVQFAEN